jgi:NADPH:quinone reductase-like Zn-dependent oxidoreductase
MRFEKEAKLPELGDHDCLVKIDAVSLNYRDLTIPKASHSNQDT